MRPASKASEMFWQPAKDMNMAARRLLMCFGIQVATVVGATVPDALANAMGVLARFASMALCTTASRRSWSSLLFLESPSRTTFEA